MDGRLLFHGFDTYHDKVVADIVIGTQTLMTAVTTSMATYIICWRILAATDNEIHSRGRYKPVIRILVESASLFSVTAILAAICNFLAMYNGNSLTEEKYILQFDAWMGVIFVVVTVGVWENCSSFIFLMMICRDLHQLSWSPKSVSQLWHEIKAPHI